MIVILTDDEGFAASEVFGGVIATPAFARLASEGLTYNNFHTTAMCSPTRAALLTGRNHHNVEMGRLSDLPSAHEGYTSIIPDSAGTIADVLKENGYSTAMFGKSHLTPSWELTQVGPFDHWPTGLGFEYFYGFLQGDTNQWTPTLVENTRYIEPPANDQGYILDKDLADKTIDWLKQHKATAPKKPFFIYYATGSTHSPHHAPDEWVQRFKGKFDRGWDQIRAEIFARQKAIGIIPANTILPPRPEELPAWDSLTSEQKRVSARFMEAYAGQLAFLDSQIGRILNALDESSQGENTIIVLIRGDNGASAEGGLYGNFYEQYLNFGLPENITYDLANLHKIGGPLSSNNYPAGWAWAMNTPFKGFKQQASHFGGTRNGLIIRWPRGIKATGQLRQQFGHVTDIAPTLFDATGITPPKVLNGVTQRPIDGRSLRYTFAASPAAEPPRTQYFEMLQNVAIYQNGWIASTTPTYAPWNLFTNRPKVSFDERKWELYKVSDDFSQARDLALTEPSTLRELKHVFQLEAQRNNVLPLHNAGTGPPRPGFERRTSYSYLGGTRMIHVEAAPPLGKRSYEIIADVTVDTSDASGVIVAHGGRFSGYTFHLDEGRPTFTYNGVPPNITTIQAAQPLGPGRHKVRLSFTSNGPAAADGGSVSIEVNGRTSASGEIGRTLSRVWFTEGLDVGQDLLTPVSPAYASPNAFEGVVHKVEYRLD